MADKHSSKYLGPAWHMGQVTLDDVMACEKCGKPTQVYAQAPASLADMKERFGDGAFVVPAIDCYPMCERCFVAVSKMSRKGRARYLAARTVRISREVFGENDIEGMDDGQWSVLEESLYDSFMKHAST